MKSVHLFIPLFLIFFLSAYSAYAQSHSNLNIEGNNPSTSELLKWHEVFTYEVKYSLFKLGEIQVEVLNDTLFNGERAWHLRGIIKSSPGIPFVGKEENHYHSIFHVVDGMPRELVYWKDDVDEGDMNEDRYIFNYEMMKVHAFKNNEAVDTLDLEQPATSGPLMFFFSRILAGNPVSSRTFVYVDEQKGTIDMEYTLEMEKRNYDAYKEPVETFYSEGNAGFDGPFGFGGRFKAWFANNALRVPVEAHLKVWLGNVRVRLIDYKKELWDEKSSI